MKWVGDNIELVLGVAGLFLGLVSFFDARREVRLTSLRIAAGLLLSSLLGFCFTPVIRGDEVTPAFVTRVLVGVVVVLTIVTTVVGIRYVAERAELKVYREAYRNLQTNYERLIGLTEERLALPTPSARLDFWERVLNALGLGENDKKAS